MTEEGKGRRKRAYPSQPELLAVSKELTLCDASGRRFYDAKVVDPGGEYSETLLASQRLESNERIYWIALPRPRDQSFPAAGSDKRRTWYRLSDGVPVVKDVVVVTVTSHPPRGGKAASGWCVVRVAE